MLQELAQKRGYLVPVYVDLIPAPDGNGGYWFSAEVKLHFNQQDFCAVGKAARTKKDAQKNAAYAVMTIIQQQFPNDRILPGQSSPGQSSSSSYGGSEPKSSYSQSSYSQPPPQSSYSQPPPQSSYSQSSYSQPPPQSSYSQPPPQSSYSQPPPQSSYTQPPPPQSSYSQPHPKMETEGRSFPGVVPDNTELIKLKLELHETTIKKLTERCDLLERKYEEVTDKLGKTEAELKEYVDKQVKIKSASSGNGNESGNGNSGSVRNGDNQRQRQQIVADEELANEPTIFKLDEEVLDKKYNDNIPFYRYQLLFSHGANKSIFFHAGQEYQFKGYWLYSTEVFPKPTVTLMANNKVAFSVTIKEAHTDYIGRDDFARMLTFHNFFYVNVLGKTTMKNSRDDDMYFVPRVECITNPSKSYFQTLIDLITAEDISKAPSAKPGSSEFHAHYDKRCLRKVLQSPGAKFIVCRKVDYSADGKDKTGRPSLWCVPSKKVSYSLFFPDQYSTPADNPNVIDAPIQWVTEADETNTIHWENYIKKSKHMDVYDAVRTLGITAEMHDIAKAIVSQMHPKIVGSNQLQRLKDVVSVRNPRKLREVFTPRRQLTHIPPNYIALVGNDCPYGDNQRVAFLGESLLNFCTGLYEFSKYPNATERLLTTRCVDATSNEKLQSVYDRFKVDFSKLAPNIRTDKDIKLAQADIVRALFGLVYLEKGINEAYEFINGLVFNDTKSFQFPTSYDCQHRVEKELNDDQKQFLFLLDIKIRRECLFHEAFQGINNINAFERLRFLGNTYLDLVVSDFIYNTYQKEPREYLETCRAVFLKNEHLAMISHRIKIREGILDKPQLSIKQMGEFFLSLIGFMYLDIGAQDTKLQIQKLLPLTEAAITEALEAHQASARPVCDSTHSIPSTNQDITIPLAIKDSFDYQHCPSSASSSSTCEQVVVPLAIPNHVNHNSTISNSTTTTTTTNTKDYNHQFVMDDNSDQ
ncbi:hypothetical protein SAMD00019534_015390 [Acytostelium subglobosum LB1]|uniref:hypothetical protein n=1 Tax=Acytostelium subglobosum LB1 TaxID=1410327 RepID=UPI000644C250|nr:hypothetical protein SAMD00019534_015390 [Acytostelium subglobosum LB1]GAM18364.1 hypothetical protein SAMD00019534_015390 [Acytostelium subglobosum LB1]|eukprot:XP_012757584.1 hypothetical protein SAMD00019534_015390 [Acytostelium subglobosum LB1]